MEFNTILPQATRHRMWQGEIVVEASSIYKSPVTSKLEPFDIRTGTTSVVAFYGPPGSGKSTGATKIADQFPGPVLYCSIEEGIGESLRARLKRLEIHRKGLWFCSHMTVGGIDSQIDAKQPGLVVIDSLTSSSMTPDDLLSMAHEKKVIVLAVLQVTKAGLPAGENAILHDADVCVSFENLEWSLTKSRFQGTSAGGKV
jgi:predicted ATP-dependent serine protease